MRSIIWVAITVVCLRGLFVFDMGASAARSFPEASAICLVGALIAAVLMFCLDQKQTYAGKKDEET